MAKFRVNQKKPNMKQHNDVSAPHVKTPRVKTSDVGLPTHQGDLGILRIKPAELPRMSKANTMTSDGISHSMKNIMKKTGMFV